MSRSCKECAHHNPDFIDEVCLHCSWPEFAGEPSNFKPKPTTHYDLLVRKSPEELAKFLAEYRCVYKASHCMEPNCEQCWLNWLKQETEGGK